MKRKKDYHESTKVRKHEKGQRVFPPLYRGGFRALRATPEAGKLCERKLFRLAVGISVSGIALVLSVLRLVCLEAVIGFAAAALGEIVDKISKRTWSSEPLE